MATRQRGLRYRLPLLTPLPVSLFFSISLSIFFLYLSFLVSHSYPVFFFFSPILLLLFLLPYECSPFLPPSFLPSFLPSFSSSLSPSFSVSSFPFCPLLGYQQHGSVRPRGKGESHCLKVLLRHRRSGQARGREKKQRKRKKERKREREKKKIK